LTIVFMLGLSLLRTNWAAVKAYFFPPARPAQRGASGD
jgi:hypothetical protein